MLVSKYYLSSALTSKITSRSSIERSSRIIFNDLCPSILEFLEISSPSYLASNMSSDKYHETNELIIEPLRDNINVIASVGGSAYISHMNIMLKDTANIFGDIDLRVYCYETDRVRCFINMNNKFGSSLNQVEEDLKIEFDMFLDKANTDIFDNVSLAMRWSHWRDNKANDTLAGLHEMLTSKIDVKDIFEMAHKTTMNWLISEGLVPDQLDQESLSYRVFDHQNLYHIDLARDITLQFRRKIQSRGYTNISGIYVHRFYWEIEIHDNQGYIMTIEDDYLDLAIIPVKQNLMGASLVDKLIKASVPTMSKIHIKRAHRGRVATENIFSNISSIRDNYPRMAQFNIISIESVLADLFAINYMDCIRSYYKFPMRFLRCCHLITLYKQVVNKPIVPDYRNPRHLDIIREYWGKHQSLSHIEIMFMLKSLPPCLQPITLYYLLTERLQDIELKISSRSKQDLINRELVTDSKLSFNTVSKLIVYCKFMTCFIHDVISGRYFPEIIYIEHLAGLSRYDYDRINLSASEISSLVPKEFLILLPPTNTVYYNKIVALLNNLAPRLNTYTENNVPLWRPRIKTS